MWGVGRKGPPGGGCAQVTGVLGINILRKCYHEFFGQQGTTLFLQHCVSEAPEPVMEAIQHCHHATVTAPQDSLGRVKVRGKRAWRILGGVMKIVATT